MLLTCLKCPSLQMAITQEIFDGICSIVNQVIYSSSPISWTSFKPLAQILFDTSCWQVFILIFSKEHNSGKVDYSDKKKKKKKKKKIRVSYFSMRSPYMKFQTLACTVHKIWHASDFIDIFQRGITPEKEITRTRKKYGSAIFPWGIHYTKFQNTSTHG